MDNILLPMEVVEPHKRRFRSNRAEYVERGDEAPPRRWASPTSRDSYPWQLSGGMQQRSNLCRALIHEPELLMLDEPFGALDAFTREELWGVMQALWMEKRFTGVLVTHDLREAVYPRRHRLCHEPAARPHRDGQRRSTSRGRARSPPPSSRTSSTSSTSCATASTQEHA